MRQAAASGKSSTAACHHRTGIFAVALIAP